MFLFLFSEEFTGLIKWLGTWRERPGLGKYGVYLVAAILAAAGLGLILRFFFKVFSQLFIYE
ncbi:MAG: hypothetical protein A3K23_05715 [Desulfobacca sp. RBG_16_58_9]|nr:MAG: hypothetical protein A3K23_05715 [Desulfobacca sp. RBG_16_58_9]